MRDHARLESAKVATHFLPNAEARAKKSMKDRRQKYRTVRASCAGLLGACGVGSGRCYLLKRLQKGDSPWRCWWRCWWRRIIFVSLKVAEAAHAVLAAIILVARAVLAAIILVARAVLAAILVVEAFGIVGDCGSWG